MYLLTIDVESWVQRPVYGLPLDDSCKELDNGFTAVAVDAMLRVLAEHNRTATFFVLGRVAEWYPKMVDRILEHGHEVAYHGYSHQFLDRMGKGEFERELDLGTKIFQKHGIQLRGFRAPTFSLTSESVALLKDAGYSYDSSVIPVKSPLYDGSMYEDSRVFRWPNTLLEVPVSVYKSMGMRFPTGGFYFRVLGVSLSSILIERVHKEFGVAMLYLHPWELVDYAGVDVSLMKKVFAKYGVPAMKPFEALLDRFPWSSVSSQMTGIVDLLDKG